MNPCKNVLENALGRPLNDVEFNQIASEFKKAQADAGRDFGKGFNSLPKDQKARLISAKFNQNRAVNLTSLEYQLLQDKRIADISTDVRSTLGQALDVITGKELADNVNNMIGNTVNRTDFLNRGGSRITFDSSVTSINNRFGRILESSGITDLMRSTVSFLGLKLNKSIENNIMDDLLTNPSITAPLFKELNEQLSLAGLPNTVTKFDISLSRDDIVQLYTNSKNNIDTAAIEFEASVLPLLDSSKIGTLDIKQIYKDILNKADTLDATGVARNGADVVSALPFKDGSSYMDFLRKYSNNKDLNSHIANTVDRTANTIAKKRVFGDEDVAATIQNKINAGDLNTAALLDAKRAYEEVVAGTLGRAYDMGIADLGLSTIKSYAGAAFLGRSAIKGTVTDRLNITVALLGRGNIAGAIEFNINALNFGKQVDNFYSGTAEISASLGHYINTGNRGVLSKDSFVKRGLQRTSRNTKNLNGTIQAVQGQNMLIKSIKRSIAGVIEKELFTGKFNNSIGDSISPITHQSLKTLDLKNLRDLRSLDINTYNTKLNKTLTPDEFRVAKNDLELEVESALMHQIQAMQIDSGGISVRAQTSRLAGDQNAAIRRYGVGLFGQFMAYSQNFLLKNNIIRGILGNDNIGGKVKWAALYAFVAIAGGYSNYNINEALKNTTTDEAEYADPISDLEAMFDGDKEASERIMTNILSGSSLPGVKQLESGELTSPAISLAYGVGGAALDVAVDQDKEAVSKLVGKALPFNLPFLREGILVIRESIEE